MTNISARLQQALQFHRSGNLAAAEQIYKQILAEEPENAYAISLLSTIAYQVGNLDVASQLIQFALNIDPLLAESYNNLGNIYKARGNFAAAVVQYQIASALEPRHMIAQNNADQMLQQYADLDLSTFAQTPQSIALEPNLDQNATSKPTISIIHHLARSGGTVLSKCLACMQDVVLLSEIHPNGSKLASPVLGKGNGYMHHWLWQAYIWHQLFNQNELLWLIKQIEKAEAQDFIDHIALIQARCTAANQRLVIRDWCHLDFLGIPFQSDVSYQMNTTKTLSAFFDLKRLFTVRHPLDQWLSTNKGIKQTYGIDVDIDKYLQGFLAFAIAAAEHGFVRYEDFVEQPAETLVSMCNYLDIAYDQDWVNKWWQYAKITGDPRAQDQQPEIKKTPRPQIDAAILAQFAASPDYVKILDLLGYNHP